MKKILVILLFAPLVSIAQNTLLYKVTQPTTGAISYLFGTMHVQDKAAFAFNDSVYWAIDQGQKTAFELNLDQAEIQNFFSKDLSPKNKQKVEAKVQKMLDVEAECPQSNLADLYDPLIMPPKLVKARQELDKAVYLCYRPQAFTKENARIEYLFELYNQYTTPLLADKKGKKKKNDGGF